MSDAQRGARGSSLSWRAILEGIGPAGIVVLAVVAVEFALIYWRAAGELYVNWMLVDSYYTHGFLVPPVSVALIWLDRKSIARLPVSSSRWGFAWIAIAGFLVIASDFLGFRVFAHVSIIPMLVGMSMLFQGSARTIRIWFPLAFLFFMVPIPPSITQSVALDLKLLATACSVYLAKVFTLPMIQQGSTIFFKDDRLLVGDVCGGLRSLIALLALGALMAYTSKTRPWARVLIMFLAGPIAIVSNVVRIFLLCVVGYFWGSQIAAGWVHDVSGYFIFIVALTLFGLLEGAFRKLAPARQAPQETGLEGSGETAFRVVRSHWVAVVVLAVAAGLHMTLWHLETEAARNAPVMTGIEIPARVVDYQQIGQDRDVDERTKEILATSSILVRHYVSPRGRPISLSVVYAGTTRRSLHFPEVCLVGDGWEVQSEAIVPVGLLFTAKRLVLLKAEQQEAVLYWFKTGDKLTGSYFVNAYYWARNQLTFSTPTSSMIRVSTPIGPDGADSAFEALEDFAAKLTPILLRNVD